MSTTNFNAEHLAHLVNIASSMFYGTISHYKKLGLQYADVPEIVGITGACENVDTLFKVGNNLDLPLFFTQTGQLALEQALQSNHGVYTIIHSGRDEEKEDERHLRQFRLTEEEFDCTFGNMDRSTYDEEKMYELLLKHIESSTKAMVSAILHDNKKTLTQFYKRDVGALANILQRPYLRITYEDAIELLHKAGYPQLTFGDDLEADHEQKIVEVLNMKTKGYGSKISQWSPVFIMRYPKDIKFFNMKVSLRDPRVVLSADCIFPYSGESVGSAVREHDGVKLLVRLLTSTMYKLHEQRGGTYNDFRWYTEGMILSNKTLPHAGYGIGNERIIQYILASSDIRDCSVFNLLNRQTGDWDTNKRGMLPMVQHKKTVLLSIGKQQNKNRLLPYIKRIKSDGHVFYATTNTYTFLEKNGVPSTHVFKISEAGLPNLQGMLKRNLFDLIINIPTDPDRSVDEHTDGSFIRKTATETGTTLITNPMVAETLLSNLASRDIRKTTT